jgi:starch phosphorylase
VEHYLGRYAEQKLGITSQQLLALGRKNAGDESEKFNMAYLAIRGSGAVNGVSQLHREVSHLIFEPLFPKWPQKEVPVGYITNGVHMPTWDSKEADEIWTMACGKDRWLGMKKNLEQDFRNVSDERLWEMRSNANKALIEFAREHFSRQLLGSGYSTDSVEQAKHLFHPDILTLGLARRFATYKRPNLLLHDPQRLLKLLNNSDFPVQLILSGKAHPADKEGQNLIKEWIQFIQNCGSHPHVIFLADYDMHISENIVQGVDVWINTPRRPWEASGTSGMKVLVNGGINLSVLDGWWAEAYNPDVGWALGDGKEHENNETWDAIEAEQLYNILEKKVVPEFYNRNEKGIPVSWISRMRESMAQLTPRFSADRAVREYTEQHYLPAAKAFLDRAANNGEIGKQLTEKFHTLEQKWDSIYFGDVKFITLKKQHKFEVEVYFKDLDPDMVQVELYANGNNGEPPFVKKMTRGMKLKGSTTGYNYFASVTSALPAADVTPRVIPNLQGISIPLESVLILWQH